MPATWVPCPTSSWGMASTPVKSPSNTQPGLRCRPGGPVDQVLAGHEERRQVWMIEIYAGVDDRHRHRRRARGAIPRCRAIDAGQPPLLAEHRIIRHDVRLTVSVRLGPRDLAELAQTVGDRGRVSRSRVADPEHPSEPEIVGHGQAVDQRPAGSLRRSVRRTGTLMPASDLARVRCAPKVRDRSDRAPTAAGHVGDAHRDVSSGVRLERHDDFARDHVVVVRAKDARGSFRLPRRSGPRSGACEP